MSRPLHILFASILATAMIWKTLVIFYPPPPIIPDLPPVHITRGPQDPQRAIDQAWNVQLRRLAAEDAKRNPLTWLQAGITFNGDIPVWSLFCAGVLALIAFIRMQSQMNFQDKLLSELRKDVKRLIIHSGIATAEDDD